MSKSVSLCISVCAIARLTYYIMIVVICWGSIILDLMQPHSVHVVYNVVNVECKLMSQYCICVPIQVRVTQNNKKL